MDDSGVMSDAVLIAYKTQFAAAQSQWTLDCFFDNSLKPLSDSILPQ